MVKLCPACGQAIPAHRNPVPTVDIIITLDSGVVLVKRKNPPVAWALPGGFVDYGESLEQAAVREACEETGLSIRLGRQFHTYSEPDRDPRQHTVSTVFLATAEGTPVAGDDNKVNAILVGIVHDLVRRITLAYFSAHAKPCIPEVIFDVSQI